ncbi:MAG: sensor histidine kinase, partial [Desulfobacteraceae bacterium]
MNRDTVSGVRSQILNRVLAIFSIIALPAILAGGLQARNRGWEWLPFLYALGYIPVPVCYLFRNKLNIYIRVLGILFPMYAVGVAVLMKLGLSGAGIPILLTLSVLATVILGLNSGIIVLCISLVTVALVGLAINMGWIKFDIEIVFNSIDLVAWVTAFFVFAMLSSAAVLISGIVQRHLENSFWSANARQKALEKEIRERQKIEEEQRSMELKLRQAQKMEAVGRLAGGVAHDFNNMLSVILGRAEVALMSIEPKDALYNDLHEIHQAATRSANLTGQLLAFSRKQVASPTVLNLNQAIDDQKKILKRLVEEEIDMEFKPGPNLWNIKIDPSQLDQILTNLTVNARDAIAGVGRIAIETSNVVLDNEYAASRPYVQPG